MQGGINRGRQAIGLDSIPNIPISNKAPQPEANPQHGLAIKKLGCPWGWECRACKIAVNVNGKLECSIAVLAKDAIRRAVDVENRSGSNT